MSSPKIVTKPGEGGQKSAKQFYVFFEWPLMNTSWPCSNFFPLNCVVNWDKTGFKVWNGLTYLFCLDFSNGRKKSLFFLWKGAWSHFFHFPHNLYPSKKFLQKQQRFRQGVDFTNIFQIYKRKKLVNWIKGSISSTFNKLFLVQKCLSSLSLLPLCILVIF